MHSVLPVIFCLCISFARTQTDIHNSKNEKGDSKCSDCDEADDLTSLSHISDIYDKDSDDVSLISDNYYDKDNETNGDQYSTDEYGDEDEIRGRNRSSGVDPRDINRTEPDHKKCGRNCLVREENKKYRIESFKNQILDKLQFKTLPNITGKRKPKIPPLQRIMDKYMMQGDSPYGGHSDGSYDDADFYGHTERAYTYGTAPPSHLMFNSTSIVYFDLVPSLGNKRVKKALLWTYVRRPLVNPRHNKHVFEVLVYKVDRLGKEIKKSVKHKKISHREDGWHHIDVRDIVQAWIAEPDKNHGLKIVVNDQNGENLAIVQPGNENDEGYEPMLEMKITDPVSRRTKRATLPPCDDNSQEERCCRYPLMVDFVAFGWDWVIAPTTYHANYCSGECRHTNIGNQGLYSTIKDQVPGSSPSCCTPKDYESLSLLYFDHSLTILYTTLPKMRVEKCGCD